MNNFLPINYLFIRDYLNGQVKYLNRSFHYFFLSIERSFSLHLLI